MIYVVTFLIILISFGLMVGFEYLQRYIIDNNKTTNPDGTED